MKFLKYDDFLSESFVNEIADYAFEGTQIVEAKSLGSEKDDIKFAILMATHDVSKQHGRTHMSTPKLLRELITSIKNQTHKNWKLFICADCYENEDEILDVIKELLEPSQYDFQNLSSPGERGKVDPGAMHHLGGTKAWNTAMAAIKKGSFKYAIKTGHDDVWKPDHLETHAKAYTQFPESKVVWTRTTKKKTSGGVIKWPKKEIGSVGYETLKFKEGNACDTYSWEIGEFASLKWRSIDQKTSSPKRPKYIPGDLDMWKRMGEIIDKKELKTLYIPKVTYKYRNSQGKLSG